MILQLNPPIPLLFENRKCNAILVIDYGIDYETLFLVGMDDTRELWWRRQSELKLVDNITLGRYPRNE